MRDIRIRGKLNGEWVVGGIAAVERPIFVCIRTDVWAFLSGGDNEKGQVVCHPCESTGLRDRDGVEIFEGDIVRFAYYGDELTGRVDKDGYNNWCIVVAEGKNEDDYHIKNAFNGAVIGNVFDNPELLMNNDNGNGYRGESKD